MPQRIPAAPSTFLVALAVAALLVSCGGSAKKTLQGLPHDPHQVFPIAARMLAEGNSLRAQELLDYVVQKNPTNRDAHFLLGHAAYQNRDYGTSVRAFADTLLLPPTLPFTNFTLADLHYNIAMAYQASGRALDAMDHLEAAVQLDSTFAEAWLTLASIQQQGGDLDHAMQSYRAAFAARPFDPIAPVQAATLLRQSGDPRTAASVLKRFLRIAPQDVDAWAELARVLEDLPGNAEESLTVLERWLQLRPDAAEAWRRRGVLLRQLDLPGAAALSFRRCLELAPNDQSCAEVQPATGG